MSDLIERQAAIDALIKWYGCEPVDIGAFENIIEKLPSAQRLWIPCSERLPEDEYVLISKKPTKLSGIKWCVTIATRTADPRSMEIKWRDIGFGTIQEEDVLAWMPLPEPYREEGD